MWWRSWSQMSVVKQSQLTSWLVGYSRPQLALQSSKQCSTLNTPLCWVVCREVAHHWKHASLNLWHFLYLFRRHPKGRFAPSGTRSLRVASPGNVCCIFWACNLLIFCYICDVSFYLLYLILCLLLFVMYLINSFQSKNRAFVDHTGWTEQRAESEDFISLSWCFCTCKVRPLVFLVGYMAYRFFSWHQMS